MYETAGIAPLSQTQVSKLLNHHSVRVKAGTHHKVGLSKEQMKKHNKAKMKGTGYNLTLDPYQVANMQYLRNEIDKAMRAAKAVRGGRLLIDEPFTTRQAVNAIGSFVKDPKGTIGFGAGGRLLIDEPFTTRQAVNTIGDFVKDPKGTLGFGFEGPLPSPDHRPLMPYRNPRGKGLPETLFLHAMGYGLKKKGKAGKRLHGKGFWEDVGKVAKKAGKTAVKALANEVVQYAGPAAATAFAAAATASGNPEFAPAAAAFGNELGSRAGRYANNKIQGMGVKKRRGRPKKGGDLRPAGAPPSIMGRGNRKKAMHFAV